MKLPANEESTSGGETGERKGVERRGRGSRGRCVGAVCQAYALSLPRPSPLPPHDARRAAVRRRWAHMYCSAVRAPSCVGRVPLRLFLLSWLRARGAPAEGERSEREGVEGRGSGGQGRSGGYAPALRVLPPLAPRPCLTTPLAA